MGYGKSIRSVLGKLPKEIAALVLAPSLIVLVIALFFGWGLQSAVIAVSVQDTGFDMPGGMGHLSIPDQLLTGLDKKVFHVIRASNQTEAYQMVQEGKAAVGLYFPEGLTQEMMIKLDDPSYVMKVKIGLSVDKSNPIVVALTAGKIVSVLAKNAQGLSLENLPIPVDLSEVLKSGVPNIGAFIMPGIFILLLYIISVIASTVLTMNLKNENTALRSGGANAAFVTVFTVVFALQAALLFLAGIVLFRVNIPGNLALASLPVIVMMFCGAAFGTFYSTAVKKSVQMAGAVIYSILPIFLGGVIFPLELVPVCLRWLCYLLPPFYAVRAFRGFTLYNGALSGVWMLTGILLLIGVVFLAASVVIADKKKEA